MFFYGTLKTGQRNHDAFCTGALSIQPATVPGRLYALSAGYPALIVPEAYALATGTADPVEDALTAHVPRSAVPAAGPTVAGELYAFDDPGRRLPALDLLEGFDPNDPSGEYRRILIPVTTPNNRTLPAWAYVQTTASGRPIPAERWP